MSCTAKKTEMMPVFVKRRLVCLNQDIVSRDRDVKTEKTTVVEHWSPCCLNVIKQKLPLLYWYMVQELSSEFLLQELCAEIKLHIS